jgi:hypothetical protein
MSSILHNGFSVYCCIQFAFLFFISYFLFLFFIFIYLFIFFFFRKRRYLSPGTWHVGSCSPTPRRHAIECPTVKEVYLSYCSSCSYTPRVSVLFRIICCDYDRLRGVECSEYVEDPTSGFITANVEVSIEYKKRVIFYFSRLFRNRSMHQAVSRRSLDAEAWVQSQTNLCGICGGHISIETGFSPSTSMFYCHYHSTDVPYSFTHLSTTLQNDSN